MIRILCDMCIQILCNSLRTWQEFNASNWLEAKKKELKVWFSSRNIFMFSAFWNGWNNAVNEGDVVEIIFDHLPSESFNSLIIFMKYPGIFSAAVFFSLDVGTKISEKMKLIYLTPFLRLSSCLFGYLLVQICTFRLRLQRRLYCVINNEKYIYFSNFDSFIRTWQIELRWNLPKKWIFFQPFIHHTIQFACKFFSRCSRNGSKHETCDIRFRRGTAALTMA